MMMVLLRKCGWFIRNFLIKFGVVRMLLKCRLFGWKSGCWSFKGFNCYGVLSVMIGGWYCFVGCWYVVVVCVVWYVGCVWC